MNMKTLTTVAPEERGTLIKQTKGGSKEQKQTAKTVLIASAVKFDSMIKAEYIKGERNYTTYRRVDLYPQQCWRYFLNITPELPNMFFKTLREAWEVEGKMRKYMTLSEFHGYPILTQKDFLRHNFKNKTCLVAEPTHTKDLYHLVMYTSRSFTADQTMRGHVVSRDLCYPQHQSSYFSPDSIFAGKQLSEEDLIENFIESYTREVVKQYRQGILKSDKMLKKVSIRPRKCKRSLCGILKIGFRNPEVQTTSQRIRGSPFKWVLKKGHGYVDVIPPTQTGYCAALVLHYITSVLNYQGFDMSKNLMMDLRVMNGVLNMEDAAQDHAIRVGAKYRMTKFVRMETLVKRIEENEIDFLLALNPDYKIMLSIDPKTRIAHAFVRITKSYTDYVLKERGYDPKRLNKELSKYLIGGLEDSKSTVLDETKKILESKQYNAPKNTKHEIPKKHKRTFAIVSNEDPLYRYDFAEHIPQVLMKGKGFGISSALEENYCVKHALMLAGASSGNIMFLQSEVFSYVGTLVLYGKNAKKFSALDIQFLKDLSASLVKLFDEICPNVSDKLTLQDIEELMSDYHIEMMYVLQQDNGVDKHMYYKNTMVQSFKPEALIKEAEVYLEEFGIKYNHLYDNQDIMTIENYIGIKLLMKLKPYDVLHYLIALTGQPVVIYKDTFTDLMKKPGLTEDYGNSKDLTIHTPKLCRLNLKTEGYILIEKNNKIEYFLYKFADSREKPKSVGDRKYDDERQSVILRTRKPNIKLNPMVDMLGENISQKIMIEDEPSEESDVHKKDELTLKKALINRDKPEMEELVGTTWSDPVDAGVNVSSDLNRQKDLQGHNVYWVPEYQGRYLLADGSVIFRLKNGKCVRTSSIGEHEEVKESKIPYLTPTYKHEGQIYKATKSIAQGSGVYLIKEEIVQKMFSKKIVLSQVQDTQLVKKLKHSLDVHYENTYSESVRASVDLWLMMGDNYKKFNKESPINALNYVNARLQLSIELGPMWTVLVHNRYINAKQEMARIDMMTDDSTEGEKKRLKYKLKSHKWNIIGLMIKSLWSLVKWPSMLLINMIIMVFVWFKLFTTMWPLIPMVIMNLLLIAFSSTPEWFTDFKTSGKLKIMAVDLRSKSLSELIRWIIIKPIKYIWKGLTFIRVLNCLLLIVYCVMRKMEYTLGFNSWVIILIVELILCKREQVTAIITNVYATIAKFIEELMNNFQSYISASFYMIIGTILAPMNFMKSVTRLWRALMFKKSPSRYVNVIRKLLIGLIQGNLKRVYDDLIENPCLYGRVRELPDKRITELKETANKPEYTNAKPYPRIIEILKTANVPRVNKVTPPEEIPIMKEMDWIGPQVPEGTPIAGLWAFMVRHITPIVVKDPNCNPDFELEPIIEELKVLIDTTKLKTFDEYLKEVLPSKRRVYQRGYDRFKKLGIIPNTYEAMVKYPEKQYKKPTDVKPRNIMNPSDETKAVCGWFINNLMMIMKLSPTLGPHFIQGKSPSELEEMILEGYRRVKNPVTLIWDGGRHDAHQHSHYLDSVDNFIYSSVGRQLAANLGLNTLEITELLQNLMCLSNKVTIRLSKSYSGLKKVGKSWQIKLLTTLLNGTVFSGHPGRTTFGNTTRVLALIRRIAKDAGLIWQVDIWPAQAGDDTAIVINSEKLDAFLQAMKVYYSTEEGKQHVHGYGQLATGLKICRNQFEFLSKVGYVDRTKCVMARQIERVVTTGILNTSSLTTPELNKVVTDSLEADYGKVYGMDKYIAMRRTLGSVASKGYIDPEAQYKQSSRLTGDDIGVKIEQLGLTKYHMLNACNGDPLAVFL